MKKMRVRFLGGTHPIYQEIVNYPPKNVKYSGVTKSTRLGNYYQAKKITTKISKIFQTLNLPRIVYLPKVSEDLIHSSRGILIINKKPWVMDIEHPASFFGLNLDLLKNKSAKRIVKKFLESGYCKKIMPHCEASKKELIRYLNSEKITKKIEVVYPATHIPKITKQKHSKIRILSVLTLFYEKGGLQVLETFSRLEKKYNNIELWIKADVPDEIKKKYSSKRINYIPYKAKIMPRESLLKEIYAQCDIFLYPSFADTFGYSILDAAIAKIPSVASDNFAIPELVEDKKSGFIVHTPISYAKKPFDNECKKVQEKYVNGLVKKTSLLIKNKKLREKMGNYGYSLIKEGKFSLKDRNDKLTRIYAEAIK